MNVALGNWRECGFSVTPRREIQGRRLILADLGRSRRVPATMRSKSGAADTVDLQFFVIGEIKHLRFGQRQEQLRRIRRLSSAGSRSLGIIRPRHTARFEVVGVIYSIPAQYQNTRMRCKIS